MKTKILFALISFSIIISCSRHANEMIDQNWKLVNVDGDNVKKVKDQMKADEANIKAMQDSLQTLTDPDEKSELQSSIEAAQAMFDAMYPSKGALPDSFYLHVFSDDSFYTNINGNYGGRLTYDDENPKKSPELKLDIAGGKNEKWTIIKITEDSLITQPNDGIVWTFISIKGK